MNFGLSEIFGMITGVQILVFSAGLRLKMPAVAQIFIKNIVSLATFDYLPMDVLFEKWFDLPNYEVKNPYLSAIGCDTSWFMLNMGSIWLFLAINVVIVLVLLPILTLLARYARGIEIFVSKLKSLLMWSYFIVFMTSMSVEITLSSLI